jgi:ABC-type multidrug transport system ATPase subunit
MIELSGIVREYGWLRRGRVRALDGITLRIPPGAAVGIVGPNGAGKSTLLRLLLGYLRPTAGVVQVGGQPPRTYAERRGIAYVPERPTIPTRWTVRHALHAYAALGDVEPWQERVAAVMREMGLEEVAERRVGALSKGNLQRLTLAQALLGERKLLILDEPTDGVDPEWRVRIREALQRWRAADPERVLLFASHNLDEVERIAERVAVLAEGRLRELLDLRPVAAALPPYRLVLDADHAAAGHIVAEAFPGAVPLDALEHDGAAWHVSAADLPDLNRRVALLLQHGAVLRALVPEPPSLEQRFRRSLRGEIKATEKGSK